MTSTQPASTHVVQAIQNETRLFQALRDALRQQRAAVAASDPGALDAWTDGIARLMREIEAADGHRQKILSALVERLPGSGHENEFLPSLSRHPLVARARLVFARAVREASNELTINRNVISRALDYGDGLLRTLMAGSDTAVPARGYGRSAGNGGTSAGTILVNRIV